MVRIVTMMAININDVLSAKHLQYNIMLTLHSIWPGMQSWQHKQDLNFSLKLSN